MEKILKEEINRINELLGTKSRIDEQSISSFVRGLVPTLQDDVLQMAKSVIGKNFKNLAAIPEDELLIVFKSQAAKVLRANLYAEMTNKLAMNAAKFSSKTASDLMRDLARIGVKDPEIAAAYLKKFAKTNGVDTADNRFANLITKNTPLDPTGGRKKVDVDIDMSKRSSQEIADEIGKKYGKQEIQEFVDKMNVIGFNEQQKKLFLLDYKKYHDWTAAELTAEQQALSKQLSQAQRKTLNKILTAIKDYKGIFATGAGILAVMITYFVIKKADKVTGTSDEIKKLNPFKDEESSSDDSEESDDSDQAGCPPGVSC